MLTSLEAPENVLAWTIEGTLTASDFDGLKTKIATALERHGSIGIYVDATGVADITLGAVVEDLKIEWALLDRIHRFHHAAIVADKEWIKAATRFASHLISQPDIAVFDPEDREAAMAFASQRPRDGAHRKHGLTQIISAVPGVVAFELDGRIERQDIAELAAVLAPSFKGEGKVDLLLHIRNWEGFAPTLLADPNLWSLKLNAMRHLRRYAIVGAEEWLAKATDVIDPLFDTKIEHFDEERANDAWNWLARERAV